MKVTFCRQDDRLWRRIREVTCVPREGESLVWHGCEGDRTQEFVVAEVLHAYDDRPWYKEHDNFGDTVYVELRPKERTT